MVRTMAELFPATKQTMWVWFVFLTALILGSAYVTHRSSVEVAEGQDATMQIQSTREELLTWLSSHREAETSTRGFLLTSSEPFLGSFEPSLGNVHRALKNLRALVREDAANLPQLEAMAAVGQEKEDHMRRLIELHQAGRLDEAALSAAVSRGKALMDEMRTMVDHFDQIQRDRLQQASQHASSQKQRASTVSLSTSGILLVFVGLFFILANRSQRERTALLERERAARAEAQSALAAEKNALDVAERANRTKDEFLAIVSHELRTPLNAILGWVAVLKGEPVDAADLDTGIATIERNARAQQKLIDELLDVTRIASGKIQLELRQVDLAVTAASAIESLRPTAELKGITLRGPGGDEHALVAGAEDRLHQVVSNLVSNAIKFTPPGGIVSLGIGHVSPWIEVVVTDTGQGIETRFLPRIFDRFIQLDGSTTRSQGGLGLGLSIVRHLVELHGGSVTAESEGLGKGSTFRVKLPQLAGDRTTGTPQIKQATTTAGPVASAPEVSQTTTAPDAARTTQVPSNESTSTTAAAREGNGTPAGGQEPASEPSIEGVQLLVLDDHADTLDALVRLLRSKGALVRTAERASAALELLREWRPDVIISDLAMPKDDGYSFIRRVRGLPAENRRWLPALALTAFARADDKEKALAAGFDDYLAKPADPVELVRKISQLIRALE